MSWLGNVLRRARLRRLAEGKVQAVRAEALDDDAKDDAERWQDYGFAANPVDGQGLVINVAGHTIVLRMDRIAERPQLAAHEVTVWHKEGHSVTLRAGRLVEVDCDSLVVRASVGVTLDTPVVACTGDMTAAGTASAPVVAAGASLKVAGTEVRHHAHGGVARASSSTDPLG